MFIFRSVLFFCFVVAIAPRAIAQNLLDETLRRVVANSMHFFQDTQMNYRLFVRRKPVRLFAFSDVPNVQKHMDKLKENTDLLSQASGVGYEFTSVNPSIIGVITSPINEGNKPNRQLLRRVGLPEEAIEIVGKTEDWSSGCGIYSFIDPDGGVYLTLIFADKNLPDEILENCTTEGTLRAFGLRPNAKSTIQFEDSFLHHLFLIKALGRCDKELVVAKIQNSRDRLQEEYVKCAVEYIKMRL